jgi:hypothetical protein
MSVSTRTRFEILKRDGFRCRYCGASSIDVLLHVDHVIARASGGTDDHENLVAACSDCNLGKSDVPLDEIRAKSGPTIDDAIAHADQIRQYLEAQKSVEAAREEVVEYLCQYWRDNVGDDPLIIWAQQVKSSVRYHPIAMVIEAIDAVASKRARDYLSPLNAVKYFHGVMRKKAGS